MFDKKLTATKIFTWDMAHMLDGHKGLCKNLHGHTYKMEVTAMRYVADDTIQEGPSAGMVLDFKDLKKVVNDLIIVPLDHATMVNVRSEDPFEQELRQILIRHSKKYFATDFRPTAENMAKYFLEFLNKHLEAIGAEYRVACIKLYETPTSYAEAWV